MRYAAIVLAFLMWLPKTIVEQCGTVDRNSPEAVREEVDRLFNRALDGMEHTLPSGGKAITWMPPDDSVRLQVVCIGPASVPKIVELLSTTHRSFGHYLAIRMLGWAGGPEIVPPLTEILLRSDNSQLGLKREALEALLGAPADKALPVVESVIHSEKNKWLVEEATSVAEKLKNR